MALGFPPVFCSPGSGMWQAVWVGAAGVGRSREGDGAVGLVGRIGKGEVTGPLVLPTRYQMTGWMIFMFQLHYLVDGSIALGFSFVLVLFCLLWFWV